MRTKNLPLNDQHKFHFENEFTTEIRKIESLRDFKHLGVIIESHFQKQVLRIEKNLSKLIGQFYEMELLETYSKFFKEI